MTVRVNVVQGADVSAPGLSRAQEPLLAELERMPGYDIRRFRFHSTNSKALFGYIYGPLPARLLLHRADVVHLASTWYAHLVPLLPTPVVVTCHDLIEIGGRSSLKPHRRFHLRAAMRGLRLATLVVCDSHAIAGALHDEAPELVGRIRVVPLGVAESFTPGPPDRAALSSLGVRPPYVLFVGSEQPRKNVPRLALAVAAARRSVPDLQFVKVGHHQTVEGRACLLDALRAADMEPDTVFLDSVSDSQLVELYRGAGATAHVSLQEGFGFPPVEAMACGCPTVVSEMEPLLEVTAGAALTVDPLDVESIAAALVSLLLDSEVRKRAVAAGLSRARHFSWHRAARDYADAYQEALALS